MMILMLVAVFRFCAADPCDWTGRGLTAGVDSRIILQVRLRCTEGSVRWVQPGHSIRVVLEPNLASSRRTTVCIKPSPSLRGASVFLERHGELRPLRTDRLHQVICYREYGPELPAIYVQTNPQRARPWTRRRLGFKYELLGNRSSDLHHLQASCQPCNDTQLLSAICSSDFVVRGYIQNVTHHVDRQTSSVEVKALRVYWQRSGLFVRQEPDQHWRGSIHTHLQCHVTPGGGVFLFTGSEHFGEAWLGCAPRYKDFLSLYRKAKAARRNSCEFPVDWDELT